MKRNVRQNIAKIVARQMIGTGHTITAQIIQTGLALTRIGGFDLVTIWILFSLLDNPSRYRSFSNGRMSRCSFDFERIKVDSVSKVVKARRTQVQLI